MGRRRRSCALLVAVAAIACAAVLLFGQWGPQVSKLLGQVQATLGVGQTPAVREVTVIVTVTPVGMKLAAATVTPQASATPKPSPNEAAARTHTPQPTSGPPRAVVTSDTLNFRSGPGTSFPRLQVLKKGDAMVVTGRTKAGDWLEVTLPDGTKGWVSASLVKVDVAVTGIAVAQVIPKPPTPSASRTPAPPTPTLTVDEQIAKIAKGKHGDLPQPGEMGGVGAGGEAEVTIINDTPNTLTVLVGSPSSVTITVPPCGTCKFYGFVGPIFCQEEGRPKQVVRLKPGTSKVVARVNDKSVSPFYGTWELKPDTAYLNCFFIVTQ
jgi:hypothetical protein